MHLSTQSIHPHHHSQTRGFMQHMQIVLAFWSLTSITLGYQFGGLDGLTGVPVNSLVESMCSWLTWTLSIHLLHSTALIVAPWAIYLNLLKQFYQIWQSGEWRMALASILNTAVQILILERLMCFHILMLQLSVISLDVYQLIPTVGL